MLRQAVLVASGVGLSAFLSVWPAGSGAPDTGPHQFPTRTQPPPTRTPTPEITPRPGDLGWQVVDGFVHPRGKTRMQGIAGARVDYVHRSADLRSAPSGTVYTDARGSYELYVYVMSDDMVRITASAAGFQSSSREFSGSQIGGPHPPTFFDFALSDTWPLYVPSLLKRYIP
jgi:hypothetical protein